MRRLFVFAIGGTGSRVLKSLTMLLAAGIKPASPYNYEVIPIIIDPHKSNEDLKRTTRLLETYQQITREIGFDCGFFSSCVSTLNKFAQNTPLTSSFTFNLQQVANQKFRDYIDYRNLDSPTKALADILFSGSSIDKRGESVNLLDIEMDIGFVGNPNVGSVVLNQFKDSEEFKVFASNFDQHDRIFVISSIFGGTGAAGFPIIVKNLRDATNNVNIDSRSFLKDAKIGAVSVLPYFNLEKDNDSPIQKSDFVAKTRSALHYYKDNITGNRSVNAMYYIGDDLNGKPYPNDPGNDGQKNDAHFIEMAAALSIIDFMEIHDENLATSNGQADAPIFKEFGIKNDAAEIKFSDLESFTEDVVAGRLTQLALFKKYIQEEIWNAIDKQPWAKDKEEIDRKFLGSSFFRNHLHDFFAEFGDWLNEMQTNKRSFAPFNLDADLNSIINGQPITKGFFNSGINYVKVNEKLNKLSKNRSFDKPSVKLVKLFHEVTLLLIEKYYRFKFIKHE